MNLLSDQEFIVNVGPGGTFRKSGKYHTRPQDIDAIFDAIRADALIKDGRNPIAIFFHGGLVDETSGLNAARNMAPHILEAGCAPICFVWETGLVETISTNLEKLGETSFFQRLLAFLLKNVSKELGVSLVSGRGAVDGFDDAFLEAQLSKQIPFENLDVNDGLNQGRGGANLARLTALDNANQLEGQITKNITSQITGDLLLRMDFENAFVSVYDPATPAGSRGITGVAVVVQIAKVAYNIIKRFIYGTDHGFYPTIIEEILRKFYLAEVGAWVWKAMKDKSSVMWESNDQRTGQQQFVGRYFLERLKAHLSEFPETKVSLIGHSAGAVAICHLLRETIKDSAIFKFNHIIFLAPACRTELFISEIVNRSDRFDDIRIFTMSDSLECKDIMVPYLYTRSLLYFISGVLEDGGIASDAHILGLQRHISFQPPYNNPTLFKKLNEYLSQSGSNRLCFSETSSDAVPGLRTGSKKHGGFDDDARTLSSIIQILR